MESEKLVCYGLPELPKDFRRVLRIQTKEFIYFLDEHGLFPEQGLSNSKQQTFTTNSSSSLH
jgi:hypothetical protein